MDRKALRDAFDAAIKNPEFLTEANKGNFDVNPISGKTISNMISDLYKTPTDIVNENGRAVERRHRA